MRAPRLERYEVVEEIGRGGMSVVYRAHDAQLHRDVAVKVLHSFLADDPDARRRFRREALAVARLRHPSILEIFDSSEPGAENAYLVTELIEGETLRRWMERNGALHIPELGALVVLDLARALRHAHEQGILHRDLKPENVMVTQAGRLKLMDFGIAQFISGATRLTTTGTLLGSPAHMAPEVIDGASPDHRADLFSLGTILYWVLTGALPFVAPNPSALFRRILEGQYEPVQLLAPRVGNGLARVVERALEPEVAARYQDVSELEADLEREVRAAGFDPTELLLQAVLNDPRQVAEEEEAPLVARLLNEGRAAVESSDCSRAVDRLNRVLAFQPGHPEATRLLARASRRSPRRIAAVSASLAVGVTGLFAGLAIFGAAPPSPGAADPASGSLRVPSGPALEKAPLSPSAPASIAMEPSRFGVEAAAAPLDEERGARAGGERVRPVRARPADPPPFMRAQGAAIELSPRAATAPKAGGRAPLGGERTTSFRPARGASAGEAGDASPAPRTSAPAEGAAKSAAELADGSAAELATKSAGEGATKSAAELAGGNAAELADGSAAEGTAKSAAELAAKSAAELADGNAAEGTAKSAAELADGSAAEGTAKSAAELAGGNAARLADGSADELAEGNPDEAPAGNAAEGADGSADELAEGGADEVTAEGTRAVLAIRIGRTFANVRLDGRTRLRDCYRGELELEPGRHRVEVVKPGLGRFEAREIEVTKEGELFERLPTGGRRPLVGGALDFRVPLTQEQAARTPGWLEG